MPNVLLIYSDQHRYDCVGVNGHPLVRTPHLDQLAADGANFSHAFPPVPVCVPARCSFITGQWPTQHGATTNFDGETSRPIDPNCPTMARSLRDCGFRTVHIGKWHVDHVRGPHEFGFDEYVPARAYWEWRNSAGLPKPPSSNGLFGEPDLGIAPEQSPAGWEAGQVIRYLEQARDSNAPFLLRWHLGEPHLPCRPSEPFCGMYDPATIEPWPGFADTFENKPLIQRQMRATWEVDKFTWQDWAPSVAMYLGVVSQIDAQIGRVLEALARLGYADDTLVVYTTDHGDMCGSHGMIDKHCIMYDDVVRVPLIMRWPGVIPTGTATDAFVSNAIDLPVTFCDAAGVEPPSTFSGRSALPAATGTESNPRQDILAMYHGNQFGSYTQRMVRNRRWKYIWNATALDELYDLQNDPGELRNLAVLPESRPVLASMRKRLVEWMADTNDTLLNGWTRKQLLDGRIVC